ncbi:MAG: hypothetical protein IKG01_01720, partial [Lachnospiraceae bacterium]|nr:hypothetical protein [Lachnospiraceae bacterium]
MSSFQIIICGFLAVILIGTLLLMLPFSTVGRQWASFDTALFTSVSAVCVTGLVVQDTASFWSAFGQFIIMLLIQIGGLGIISVTAFLVTVSGRKISLLQRSLLMESISADQVGGIGFLTWGDVAFHGIHFKRYRMQSKVIIATTACLILFPTVFFFLNDFAAYPLKQRLCLSLFQAVTPR